MFSTAKRSMTAVAAAAAASPPIAAAADAGHSSDDSGELWISPKLSRSSTNSQSPPPAQSIPATVTDTAAQTNIAVQPISPAPSALATTPLLHSRRKAHIRRTQQKTASSPPPLSPSRIIAWYIPRILLLFSIGWSWSVGIQLIHAQQRSLLREDSSDSDDLEFPYESLFGWRRGLGPHGLTRDLISRVLAQAPWSNALSGLLTVLVGLMYPFLDRKWLNTPLRRTGWNDVLRCVGGFLGVNYAALKLPFESASQSSACMIIISLGLWTVCDGSLHGFLVSLNASLMATWVLYVHALVSLDEAFTREDYLGLLSYLPSVLFTYCVMTGSIGRSIAFRAPVWTQNRISRRNPRIGYPEKMPIGLSVSSTSNF